MPFYAALLTSIQIECAKTLSYKKALLSTEILQFMA